MNLEQLQAEREQLQKRLEWLGVRSTGYERIERTIAAIDARIKEYEVNTSSDAHKGECEAFG